MRTYKQLTREQRYQLYALMQAESEQTKIAQILEVHRSTISRELKRNKGKRGYRPKQADEKTNKRRAINHKVVKLNEEMKEFIEEKIREQWSPEQISGWQKLHHIVSLSHERIYQYIWEDKQKGGDLWMNLRQSKKKRKKRYGKKDRRGSIPNRVSIEERPGIVETKERVGDWEIDLVIGKDHKGALVSIVERKTKYTLIRKIDTKEEENVTSATINMLSPHRAAMYTLTCDNGKEFSGHEKIAASLDAKVYFAHPYRACERALNENTNGLIRQYFPKKTDLRYVTEEHVNIVMDKLNNRPRKTLTFKTPKEMLINCIDKDP